MFLSPLGPNVLLLSNSVHLTSVSQRLKRPAACQRVHDEPRQLLDVIMATLLGQEPLSRREGPGEDCSLPHCPNGVLQMLCWTACL